MSVAPASCADCGAPLAGGARFCSSCGRPVEHASAVEERKVITVLFADLVGSTALGERLDPERLQEVVNAYLAAMRTEIEAAGGTVEKFIGDAVMAVFGLPAAHGDDPDRALHAALGMRDRLPALNDELERIYGVRLENRIGVNTGEVISITGRTDGERLLGDAVNVAARLEQAATPGQVLLGERTARGVRRFEVRAAGDLELKGKQAPVAAFELIGERAAAEERSSELRAPLVGRDQELALLTSLHARVAAEGRPHLVTISGDPGVGKSRLVRELLQALAARGDPPEVARGRCLPYGEGVTYWPLAEIIKGRAGVLDNDSPGSALEKIAATGREMLGAGPIPDLRRTIAALAFTFGVDDPEVPLREVSPRRVQAEITDAWSTFFSALAAGSSAAVVIEDIHWADPALLDLLEELTRRVAGGLLFVCTARPELTTSRAASGGGERDWSSLSLDPLGDAEADRLLHSLLASGELPGRLEQHIVESSGGNPFFLEEIIRMLVDDGRLVRANGGWEAAGGVESIEVPDNVQAVLASRIDLLSAEQKRALQCASVVGRVFWTGAVARLADCEDREIEDLLVDVQDRELVLGRLQSSLAGQREYAFKHALTREVAYESLPRRDRARIHADVASWIEDAVAGRRNEFLELLAHHYERAYCFAAEDPRSDPEALERLRRQAHEDSLAAAEAARRKLALERGAELARQALAISQNPLERAQAHTELGIQDFTVYYGDVAWMHFKAAADQLVESGTADPSYLAEVCALAAEIPTRWPGSMTSSPSPQEIERYLDIGMAAVPPGDSRERAHLLVGYAFLPWGTFGASSAHDARPAGEEAAAMARRVGDPDLESAALDALTSGYSTEGRYGELEPMTARRLELADRVREPVEVGDTYAMAAWHEFHTGRYGAAAALAEEGVRRSAGLIPSAELHCLAWKLLAWFRLGRWDDFLRGLEYQRDLLGERRDTPPLFAARPFAVAVLVHELRGEPDQADLTLSLLDRLERPEDYPPSWTPWTARVLALRGDFDQSRVQLDEGLGARDRSQRGLLLEALCDVAALQGAWQDAPEILAESRAEATHGALVALPCFADRLEGLAAQAAGDFAGARAPLQRAGEGFRALQAAGEAALCDTALSRLAESGGGG